MPEPKSFSPNNAKEAASEMYDALGRVKKSEYLGNLNEILVVIDKLSQGLDRDKAV